MHGLISIPLLISYDFTGRATLPHTLLHMLSHHVVLSHRVISLPGGGGEGVVDTDRVPVARLLQAMLTPSYQHTLSMRLSSAPY